MKTAFRVFVGLLIVDFSVSMNKKTVKLSPEAASAMLLGVQTCMPESGVPLEALLKVYQGGYNEDTKFKDFIYCCYKTAGYVQPDGRFDVEKSAELFRNEPEVIEGLRRCGKETGPNAKERVFNFFKCFQDTVPVMLSI